MLDRLLGEADVRLAAMWPANPPRLQELFPPLTWRRKRRVVLDLAEKYVAGELPSLGVSFGEGIWNARELPPDGSWAEVQLEAKPLRLRGRADLIQRSHGDVIIRDLKTGRVLTNEGDVLPHIERQMRLYGAMAHVVWPSAQVSLIVDHGVEREVGFNREEETDLLSWLRGVLDRVPRDREVDAEPLANPGAACEGCTHRHICPAYRRLAPDFWSRRVRMPLDTWGEAIAVAPRAGDLADVTLRDAAGRTVKVFGLAGFRVAETRPGDTLWIFGLRSNDKRGGPAFSHHPLNFFEVAEDDPFARAWTVQSFTTRAAQTDVQR
jgi:hypothetical protein